MRRTSLEKLAGVSLALFFIAASMAAGEADWTVPAAEKAKKNPMAKATGERDGKRIYDTNCAMCHGPAGKGDGPGASVMTPKPRNLADKEVQQQTDGELFWKISTGRGAMPAWKQLPENERWSLVYYIRSLAKNR